MNNLSSSSAGLLLYEREFIDVVVELGKIIGLPKSVSQIYGLLLISVQSLSMEEISHRLNISLGSCSQGLKILRQVSGVTVEINESDRRDRFVAELNFRRIVSNILLEELRPRLTSTADRLESISGMLGDLSEYKREEVSGRLNAIRKLNSRANRIFPLVSKLLSY